MVKFVCPECSEEAEGGRDSVLSKAINHMRSEHHQDVSPNFVEENFAEEPENEE